MFGKHKPLWGKPSLKSGYDAVIIGGGVHGLAAAYFLARNHNMKNIAVIEKQYIGFGGSGRNTAIVRANQRGSENLLFHKQGLELWDQLTAELDFNLMFFNCGLLSLAHSEAEMSNMRTRTASAQYLGIKSELLTSKQCKELIPALDISDRLEFPITGGMYHPPGGIIRHDAAVWGLAKGAAKKGVHIHQHTEVIGIGIEKGKIVSVETDKGTLHTPCVLNAAGAYSPLISAMAGIRLPIRVSGVQAMATQPLKPLLNHVVSSETYHCYANQTLKGEIVACGDPEPWNHYTTQITADYIRHQANALTALMPCLKSVKLMRAWGGLADMTPDMLPIIDGNDLVKGFYMSCGWGHSGFKSGPIAGKYMAQFIASGTCPEIIRPFSLRRYEEYRMIKC